MPKICLNCNKGFRVNPIIKGKERNLQRRIYCLKCSPFGGGLTRRLPGDKRPYKNLRTVRIVKVGQIVACMLCTRKYAYDYSKGHLTSICNSCNANRRRVEVKKKCIAYKGGKCKRCGYCKCARAMGFHHRDRKKKDFTISKWMTKRWSLITTELDKCDLLCSNCHMEVEDEFIRAAVVQRSGRSLDKRKTSVRI